MNILPAGGESFLRSLPMIGQVVSKFTNPFRDHEEMFQKLIATKPELMDEYITREQQSPGSLAPVFGKRVSEFVRGQPVSEAYQRGVSKEKLDITGKELTNKAVEVGTKRQEVGLDSDTLKQLQDKTLWDRISNDKNAKAIWEEKSIGGEPFDVIREKIRQVNVVGDRSKLADPYIGKKPLEIAEAIRTGGDKFDANVVQAMWDRMPDTMRQVYALIDDKNRDLLSTKIKGMDRGDQDRYLRNLRWREVIDGAQKLGVSPNTYAKKFFGEEFPELSRASTPEDDAQLDTKLEDMRVGELRKAAVTDINDIQQSISSLSKGGLNPAQQSIQYGIINTSLQRLGEKLPEGTVIPQYKEIERFGPNKKGWFIGDRKINDSELLQFLTNINASILTGRAQYRPRNTATDSTSRPRNPNSMSDSAKLDSLP